LNGCKIIWFGKVVMDNLKTEKGDYMEDRTGSHNLRLRLAFGIGVVCFCLALVAYDFLSRFDVMLLILELAIVLPVLVIFFAWELGLLTQSMGRIVVGEDYIEMPLGFFQDGIGNRVVRLRDEEVKRVFPERNSLMEAPHNTLITAMAVETTDNNNYYRRYGDHGNGQVQETIARTVSVLKERFGDRFEDPLVK